MYLQENSVGVSAQVQEECGCVSLGARGDSGGICSSAGQGRVEARV